MEPFAAEWTFTASTVWKLSNSCCRLAEHRRRDRKTRMGGRGILADSGAKQFHSKVFHINDSNAATHPGLWPPLQRRGALKIPSGGGVPGRRDGFPGNGISYDVNLNKGRCPARGGCPPVEVSSVIAPSRHIARCFRARRSPCGIHRAARGIPRPAVPIS